MLISSLWSMTQRESNQRETPSGTNHFLPAPLSKSVGLPAGTSTTKHLLPNVLTPSPAPLHSDGMALPSHICLSPSKAGPLQQTTGPIPCSNHVYQCRSFAEPWFWWWQWQQVSFHKQTRTHLVKMFHIQDRDQKLSPVGK